MFSLYSRNRNGFRALACVLAATFCLLTAFSFAGCQQEPEDWEDDHQLNPNLVGKWEASGTTAYGEWTDTYVVTNTGITHDGGYGEDTFTIEYVYNFNEAKTAGGIIVKDDTSNKYTCIWFKDLNPRTQVLLGQAYDAVHQWEDEDYIADVSVGTLAEAKTKFSPAEAETYGGGSKQGGTPQTWQPAE